MQSTLGGTKVVIIIDVGGGGGDTMNTSEYWGVCVTPNIYYTYGLDTKSQFALQVSSDITTETQHTV